MDSYAYLQLHCHVLERLEGVTISPLALLIRPDVRGQNVQISSYLRLERAGLLNSSEKSWRTETPGE